jgi:hypothetical protein
MRDEVKYIVGMIVLGASLVAYAHANFASKSTVETMDARIYEIWKEIVVK